MNYSKIDSPELLKEVYPDARPTTWKDCIKDVLAIVGVCILAIVYSLLLTTTAYCTAKFEEQEIMKYDKVEGVMRTL